MTTKGTNQRRGFCFVTYISEDSVDKCTDKTFHSLDNHQVSCTSLSLSPVVPTFTGREGEYPVNCDPITILTSCQTIVN